MRRFEIVLLMIAVALSLAISACSKSATNNAPASNTTLSANSANTNAKESAPSASERASAPKGIKAPEPCSYFADSIGLKPAAYKSNSVSPERYDCMQSKPLVNYSGIVYTATGDVNNVNEFYLALNLSGRNNEKQNADLHELLALAASEIADRTGGQKLPEDVLRAILSSETKDFTLEPGADETKPQLRTVAVEHSEGGSSSFKYSTQVTMKF
jgi:hypothetical protein